MPKGQYNRDKFYAISRGRYGWSVRLTRDGQRIEKSFSDRTFGGEAKALVHARAWRDQIVREHPPRPRREKAMRPRGGSGPIPGVTCDLDARGRAMLWRAKTYVGPGKVLQKTFGVTRYGSQALQLAIEERQNQLRLVDGLAWVHPAERRLRNAAPSRRPLPRVPDPAPANQVPRSTNTSGFPGVIRRARHWTAQTVEGGKWVSQSFRIDRYGEEVSLILAVWARLDQLGVVVTGVA